MAHEEDNSRGAKANETPLENIKLSPRGKEVVKYLYEFRQSLTPEGDTREPSLSVVEEKIVQATTGIRVGPFEASLVPFGARNPVVIDFESRYPMVGDRRLKTQVGFGNHAPTLNELSLRKESEKESSEIGLLAPRDGKGPSVIGNTNPKPPLLRDKLTSAGGGVAGGFGYRSKETMDTENFGRVTVEMQASILPNKPLILQPTKPAPEVVVSVAKTGEFAGNDYLLAASLAKGKRSTLNESITVAGQRKIDDTTINLYGEAIRGDANIKRIGAEVSHHMASIDAYPYVRADVTRASGQILPRGIAEGNIKAVSVGIAKDLSKEVRGFCEVTHASDLKSPMVQCGFKAEYYSGIIPSRPRK